MHQHHSCGCGKPRATHTATKPLCQIRRVRPVALSPSAVTPLQADSPSCCGESTSSSGSDADAESDRPAAGTQQFSWRISGMDCPSCARTIETAVNQLPSVARARVLFSSEKLVVDAREDVQRVVEQAVKRAGFQLSSPKAPQPAASHWQENRSLMVLAGLMLVSAALSQFHPLWGDRLFILTTLVGLWPVARSALQRLRSGSPFTIEMLMTIASAGALLIGAHTEAAMVLLLFQLGERLEGYAAARARSGVSHLMALRPEQATRLREGTREMIGIDQLRPGDIIEVAAGNRLPSDSRLLDESASFDESAMTGESLPVTRSKGETVMAGATSVDRMVKLQVVSLPGESAIDRIVQLIEEAESHRAPLERFIDRFSRIYTPVIMLMALLVMVIPPLAGFGNWQPWIYKGLTLLLIGCPCALVISTPAAITSGLATAARQGALIKGGAALERLSRIRALAFDKTGTLTQGKPRVTQILPFSTLTQDEILALSAAVEQGSTHPLAHAVIAAAQRKGLNLPSAHSQQTRAGQGIEAQVADARIQLSAPGRVSALTAEQQAAITQAESQGQTLVVVVRDGEPVGALALQDQVREDAVEALKALNAIGIQSLMLTGDNPRAAAAIAQHLGIEYRAGLLPADKVEAVRLLNQQQPMAMVGDGINDAPAMKAATLGIAMGSGTDVALEAADAALTHNQLRYLAPAIVLARRTQAIIRQNIAIALGLKAIFLVTTLLGFTGLWLAVVADSGATALVTANALRLLKKQAG